MSKPMDNNTHKYNILISILTFVMIVALILLPILSTPKVQDSQIKTPNQFTNLVNNITILTSSSQVSATIVLSSLSSIPSSVTVSSTVMAMALEPKIVDQPKSVLIEPESPTAIANIEPQSNIKKIVKPPKPTVKKVVKPTVQNVIEIKPTPKSVAAPVVEDPKLAVDNSYIATGCDQNLANQMLDLVNNHRVASGSKKISFSSQLAGVACAHSKWMTTSGVFSHTGRDNTNPFERCKRAGTYCYAENVAYNTIPSVQDLFDQFKNSPGHNTNMLDPNFVEIGVAFDGIYVTQIFR